MLISVIVPVFNSEKYLRTCLDSILAQTLQDLEIITVNDGSTDTCSAILQEYADKAPMLKIITQANLGQAAARNAGIEASHGDYIVFWDSDDWCHPQFLEFLYRALRESQADMSCCRMRYFNDGENLTSDIINYPKPLIIEGDAVMTWRLAVPVCVKLYRRSLLAELRFQPGIIYEDVPFGVLMMERVKKLAMLELKMYYYRQHCNSTIHTVFTSKNLSSYRRGAEIIADYYRHHGTESRRKIIKNRILPEIYTQILRGAVKNGCNRNLWPEIKSVLADAICNRELNLWKMKLKYRLKLICLLNLSLLFNRKIEEKNV